MMNEPEFGELIELYTNTAVIQAQRVPVMKQKRRWELINITVAPLIENSSEGTRYPDFSAKIAMQLDESAMAAVCAGLMGLKGNIRVDGTRAPTSTEAKVLYLNNNPDSTTNINMAADNGRAKRTQSITFSYQDRYPLLRLIASQLAKNSLGYEQTIADTLNLIKASYLR
ncbi:hypothetical protein [Vibrio sp. Hal054]|uniref:hypothetical protein n=1 Tax=Vibrio sp. Hal054 TaxID=3035158 RepID=UPI00301D87A4